MIRPKLQELSQRCEVTMEETLQQGKKDMEYENPNDDQGGIRRRLRDRNLLRKRKAEAEEKETNQVESQRKRSRADEEGGTKKRGRPRKNEALAEVSVIQAEAADVQEAPAVMVVPEPVAVTPAQTSGPSQPALVLTSPAPVPVLGRVQSLVIAPTTSPNPLPSVVLPSIPASSPAKSVDTALGSAADAGPAAAPAPPLVETLYTESQGKESLEQVLVEDLGPDEEEDSPSQDKGADKDLGETPLISLPEKSQIFSVPGLSSPPPSQGYLPGN
ncbi:uncharacterized protein hemgn isoform X2 [Betta splendens]|uniref:Uncharacterized protein hemgn isoform X2 n=1 Tax=Betta splendens TaxID=158456 RepID=A0A6P7MM94_BETSP|nr:uncharacterized protein hemgn isoform X2 [Betta splendens]